MDIAGVEDIYELSPLQQGMLLQCLFAPDSDAQINQAVIDFEGDLEPGSGRAALEVLLARHPVLRTSFVWEDLEQPFQVVHRAVAAVFTFEDWTALSEDDQGSRLEQWLNEDRAAGFELSTAPLFRLVVLKTGEQKYRLVWTFHHIILEGHSFMILLSEFWRLLASPHISQSALPAPAPPFVSYIRWLQAQDRTKAERFWRRALQGMGTATHLPIDRADPGTMPSGKGIRSVSLSVPDRLGSVLREFAAAHRMTLNTVVQGAWAVLLSRYTSEDDVLFGVAVTGRPAELEHSQSMVGMFVNALPARVRVTQSCSIAQWLQELQADQVEMRQYDFSSLAQIQAWSEFPRGKPLFESLLLFENRYYAKSSLSVDSSRMIRGISLRTGSDQPLTLDVFATAKTFKLALLYEAARFGEADMARMLSHMLELLKGFVSDPTAPLSSLALITEEERAQLESWNATKAAYASEATLHELFEAQAERTPEAPAVACEEASLSYAELNARANRLARFLRGQGVGRGSVVGLCVERSVQMAVAMLGVLKAGGAYVALEPGDPVARLLFMLEDASVEVLVTQTRMLNRLPSVQGRVVDLDAEAEVIGKASGENLALDLKADDVAYVIYTSGSTGRPKGVMGLHRGMVNRLSWMWRTYPYGPDERCCQKTTLSFVDAVAEIFSPLLSGLCVVVVSETIARDARALAELIARERITRLVVVPSLLRALLGLDAETLSGLECVRHWVTSGERLDPELESAFRVRLPGAVLLNLYGSSEVSADVTCFDTAERGDREGSLIGRPIANTQAYVLDARLNPVPVGVPGELYVGGAGLARGYLRQPELTAQRFLPDPFSSMPGSRLYKTGDVVRFGPDGVLEYLGRADQQLKVRGYRIEAGEVETTLSSHPGVRQVVVLAEGADRLVAYFVTAQGASVGATELREHAARTLPAYMVPSVYVKLAALPLTASGKIDRRALPTPRAERQAEITYIGPRTQTEEVMTRIWRDVLRVERVGVRDGFFELGGHSLLATQVASRVRQTFGVELPLDVLFKNATVEATARWVEARQHERPVARTVDELSVRGSGDRATPAGDREEISL